MAENVQKRMQDYLSGTNTICPSDEDLLFYYVTTNQTKSLTSLISKKPTVLYYKEFEFPYKGDDILAIACNRKLNIDEDTVQELINLDIRDRKFDYGRALHVAVVNPKSSILEVLIRNRCDINATCESEDNALHNLIKHLRDSVDEDNEKSYVKHVKLLLDAGIDVNKKDDGNNTAIVLAAKNRFKSIVKTLLNESKTKIELDNCVHLKKTARQWIETKDLYDLTDYEKRSHNLVVKSRKDKLFELIRECKETEFLEMYESGDNPNEDDGTKTFLQYSCDKNCFEIVKFLCERGANIEKKAKNEENEMKPLRLALDHGYHKIVEFLVVEKGAEVDGESVSFSIKFHNSSYKSEDIDYEKCLNVLVNSKSFNKNINEKDGYGNTPLFNSAMWGSSSLTEALLKNGANLGSKNNLDFMPIQFINPEILEKHLDSCIETEKSKNASENHKITLKLDSLIPEQNIKELVAINSLEWDEEKPLKTNKVFNRETTIIDFMANSPELKHLLKHPVIVCFLIMKWHRVRCLFYTNVLFYSIFVLSLNTYIYMKYANFDTNSTSGPFENVATASFIALIVTYLLLWLRELFQFVVSPKRYLKNFENFIEICLLLITSIILFDTAATNDVKKQVSAFAIVFSAFELVLMLGQYPRFTTHVIMFKTVSANFVQLFLWYSLLIIAFALSFNVLFTKSDMLGGQTNSSSDGGGKEEDDVFTGPGPSLFKTLVMLTGEFDASSIDFHTYPVVSRLIFTMFVFTITIILLNLLNGLAVSDTQTIKNDAELVGHIARAKLINYFETLFIGNVLEKNRFFNYVRNLLCCCPNNISFVGNSRQFFTRKLCLFTILNNNKNIFMLSQEGCLTLDEKVDNTDEINCCNVCVADKGTIQKANIIAQKKKKDLVSAFDLLKAEQDVLKKKLDEVLSIAHGEETDFKQLKAEQDVLNKKLDEVLCILKNKM